MMLFAHARFLLLAAAVTAGAAPAHGEALRIGGTGAALGLSKALAAAFERSSSGDRVEVVPGLGTGGAISALAENVLQIAIAGRVLTAEETAKGMTSAPLLLTPFVFVTARPDAPALTRAQVVAIYAGELRAWPDGADIKPILRPRSDAATLFMAERVPGMAAAMETLRKRPDVPVLATDQDNMEGAASIAHSLAGATLLQVMTERPRVSVVVLDGVQPSVETLEQGIYPLGQELFVVTAVRPSGLTRRFLDFIASEAGRAIVRASGGRPLLIPPN
jgi:phosphate transport system substrate-binding protein